MTWTNTAYLCIIPSSIPMEGEKMASVESPGTSSEVKEEFGKYKKFVGRKFFSIPPLFIFVLVTTKFNNF